MNIQIDIPANGAPVIQPLGVFKYASIRVADFPFQISFNGYTWETARQNSRWDLSGIVPALEKVYFKSLNGNAASIILDYDTNPLGTTDTATSVARLYARGNLGIPIGAAAAGGLPACTANGYLQITNGMMLSLPGINANGQRRQKLFFTVVFGGTALQILDATSAGANLYQMAIISPPGAAGSTFQQFDTDADLIISGLAGTSLVIIGEFFLKNQT